MLKIENNSKIYLQFLYMNYLEETQVFSVEKSLHHVIGKQCNKKAFNRYF